MISISIIKQYGPDLYLVAISIASLKARIDIYNTSDGNGPYFLTAVALQMSSQ